MKINKVLILGSGALKIGEAGEFDYSGSQAIKALKEEGIKTVLVNPNIATIQTSKFLADTVYFLPVSEYFVTKVIEKEKPDGILLSFGGQTALNCGLALHHAGVIRKHNIKVLGTPISAILLTEDRKQFAQHLTKIGIPIPQSKTARSIKDGLAIAQTVGYPVMVRAGFALGGQGSGIARNENQLHKLLTHSFFFVKQVLVEKYLHHYKEIEYEVVRDINDNCITVCNMENMDPLGIHTGESIVVAPSQTLTNYEYHMLRTAAIKVVRSLGIIGECNIQFALNPNPKSDVISTSLRALRASNGLSESEGSHPLQYSAGDSSATPQNDTQVIDYYAIEVNARLSRSSALASKATGYPLAHVAAKLALGKKLTELTNKVTKVTQFCFEPALDYITVKIPRWDINKFKRADKTIGSSMKSVGEVMAIGRTFEEAYQKAIRMLDLEFEGAVNEKMQTNKEDIKKLLENPTPDRVFAISKAFYESVSVSDVYKLTGIDPWFLYRIKNIVDEEKKLTVIANEAKQSQSSEVATTAKGRPRNDKTNLTKDHLLRLKQLGFSDKRIGQLVSQTELRIRSLRKKLNIAPSVFQIDTLAGEFAAKTNYLYMTYNGNHHDIQPTKTDGIIVLGSGPYRIGSSVEFDWTTVNTALSLKQHGKQSIMINCNPETVSTDYDISDRLYFEELTFERIADIYDFENPYGVILSVGGQTPNNRAQSLKDYGCHILGTDPDDIDRAENRNKFSKLLDTLGITQPPWNTLTDLTQVKNFCATVGYPVLIRPSYVLSGSYMRICHTEEELTHFIDSATLVSTDYPITVSKFIEDAKEIELDAVAHKGIVKASIISEHIENAGVHSGDATIALPAQRVYVQTKQIIEDVATKLAKALKITGPFNIQFLAKDNKVSVIEINLRASRTFPFISKVTGVDLIKLAVDAFFDVITKPDNNVTRPQSLRSGVNGQAIQRFNNKRFVAVKVPQFSFARITGADPILHVEMASTGEAACFGEDLEEAFLKGELSVGGKIPEKGILLTLEGDENKAKFLENARMIHKKNLPIFATEKTTLFLQRNGVPAKHLYKIYEKKSPNVLEYLQKSKVDLAINITQSHIKKVLDDDYVIRRSAIDHNIPLYTDLKKAQLFIKAICEKRLEDLQIKSWDEYSP